MRAEQAGAAFMLLIALLGIIEASEISCGGMTFLHN